MTDKANVGDASVLGPEPGVSAAPSAEEKLEQVAKQCDAVEHLSIVLAKTCKDYAKMFRAGLCAQIANQVGNRTALQMEIIGDMLNGMDAVSDEDEWLAPIFDEAHRLWPQATPCPWCGEVESVAPAPERPPFQPPTEPVNPGTAPNTDPHPDPADTGMAPPQGDRT